MKKLIKDYTSSAMMLGVGNVALGAMGQGDIANKISTPASNMMGVGITAGAGMSIMNMANRYSRTRRPIRVKNGKHKGYYNKGF